MPAWTQRYSEGDRCREEVRVPQWAQDAIGTFGYAAEFTEARDLICSGAVDVSPLISRTVSLDQLTATFEEITQDRNKYQKVLVRP